MSTDRFCSDIQNKTSTSDESLTESLRQRICTQCLPTIAPVCNRHIAQCSFHSCMCVSYICMCVRMHTRADTHSHIPMYACEYIYIYIYVYSKKCAYKYTYVLLTSQADNKTLSTSFASTRFLRLCRISNMPLMSLRRANALAAFLWTSMVLRRKWLAMR